jgi:hypothetical protein
MARGEGRKQIADRQGEVSWQPKNKLAEGQGRPLMGRAIAAGKRPADDQKRPADGDHEIG